MRTEQKTSYFMHAWRNPIACQPRAQPNRGAPLGYRLTLKVAPLPKRNAHRIKNFIFHALVAQLDSVSASDAEGCGFDPRRVHQKPLSGAFCISNENIASRKRTAFGAQYLNFIYSRNRWRSARNIFLRVFQSKKTFHPTIRAKPARRRRGTARQRRIWKPIHRTFCRTADRHTEIRAYPSPMPHANPCDRRGDDARVRA